MALEYDGQRVGAMQYEGVTIGEAMIDGQIVYRSISPVEGSYAVEAAEYAEFYTYTVPSSGTYTVSMFSTGGSAEYAYVWILDDTETVAESDFMPNPELQHVGQFEAGDTITLGVLADQTPFTINYSILSA